MRTVSLLFVLLLAPTAPSAQPYVFAGVGTESSAVLGLGYQATTHFGVELSARQSTEDGQPGDVATVGPAGNPGTPDLDVKGYGIAAVGQIPITENLAAVATVGVHRMKIDGQPGEVAAVGGATPNPGTPSASETVLGFSIGARYSLKPFALRAMLEHTEGKGRVPRTDVVSLQLLYSF